MSLLHTPSSPHIHAPINVRTLMFRVIAALLPGLVATIYFFGWGIAIQFTIALWTALICEGAMLFLRKRSLKVFLTDFSAVVTALLLVFAIPPLAPWWITVTGTAFAIIVAKHLYGGLGYNPFNPAMVGYVMLLISFPLEMTSWLAPQNLGVYNLYFTEALEAIFSGQQPVALKLDAMSMATPLDTIKTQLSQSITIGETQQTISIFGDFGGLGWEWVDNWFLLGGFWLIYKKVIDWRIPLAMLGSLFVMALIFYLGDQDSYSSPMFHIFSGAAILGAFFIATDPVSAATTPKGRLLFGAGVGILTYVIRTWGGYPDGVAFAVLLMNMAAPTLDYYTQPRVYGHGPKE